MLPGSSESDPVYKISWSDQDLALIMDLVLIKVMNELSVLDGDDKTISPDSHQDIWMETTILIV